MNLQLVGLGGSEGITDRPGPLKPAHDLQLPSPSGGQPGRPQRQLKLTADVAPVRGKLWVCVAVGV